MLTRRTPMPQGKPLRRGKPLETRSAMPPARVPLQRHVRIKPRSDKTARIYVTRRQIVAEMFLYPEVCEVPWCTELATDPHEPLTRARGGDILDRENIRKVCHPHNVMFASEEQPWMYEQGFLVHSWDAAS